MVGKILAVLQEARDFSNFSLSLTNILFLYSEVRYLQDCRQSDDSLDTLDKWSRETGVSALILGT